ncbi:hypothetical protein C8R43DRAFT_443316 [Mycena crocata]|nr:hypothetical protein C8R43DRAFT_443316 [Mycena crocata]
MISPCYATLSLFSSTYFGIFLFRSAISARANLLRLDTVAVLVRLLFRSRARRICQCLVLLDVAALANFLLPILFCKNLLKGHIHGRQTQNSKGTTSQIPMSERNYVYFLTAAKDRTEKYPEVLFVKNVWSWLERDT